MDSDTLKSLAKAILPDATVSRMARVHGVDKRVVLRWMSGDATIPDDVAAWAREQARLVGELRPQAELEQIVKRWRGAGLDDETIASMLAAQHSHVTGRFVD
jgi:transposase-like protein